MATDTTTMISEYNMLDEFTDIASRYFVGVDVSKLRISLFGYVTEGMAQSVGFNLLDSMVRAKESNIYTAQQKKTLLLEAASLEIDTADAIPATIDTFIALSVSDLQEKGTKTGQDYSFTISKDTIITILGYQFLLDYDISVSATAISSGYSYSAQYNINSENQISSISNPYILTSVRTVNNINYVFMRVTLRQLSKTYSYYTVILNDDISLVDIEFTYSDQLSYFNIWYMPPNTSTYQLITSQNILSKDRPTSNYLLYDSAESGILKISAESAFVPAFNSQLRIDMYTTKGSGGDFTYNNGTTGVSLQSYENSINYGGITMICVPIGNSINGSNQTQMESLRSNIISTRSTLNGLESDNDLNIYFKKIDTDNNMLFVKKRADVIERRYTGYMIPRSPDGYIIPTNTMNVLYNLTDFDAFYSVTNRNIIKANTKFSLESGQTLTVVKNSQTFTNASDSQIGTDESDITKLLFGTPYLIVVNANPESVSYYLNSVNQECTVKPDFINIATVNQFVMNYFTIQRNAVLGDSSYNITFNLIPNNDISDIVDSTGNITEPTRLVVYGTVYNIDGTIMAYFPITIKSYDTVNSCFVCSASLITNDYLSLDDQLQITGSVYPILSTTLTDTLIPGINVKLGFCIYRLESSSNGRSTYDNIIPNMSAYTLTNVYTNASDLTNLFVDMTGNIRSTVTMPTGTSYLLSEVPLVRYSYLNKYASEMTSIIQSTKEKLSTMSTLVTNNFNLDFKLYRTYGESVYFTVGDTTTTLDRLNLSMVFNLYLPTNATQVFTGSTVDSIKSYIKTFVETINLASGQSSLFMSNLTTSIETQFANNIQAIELVSLNSYTVTPRKIIYNVPDFTTMTSQQIRNYVPEFLNISLDQITINLLSS